jgi:hypothetical protein
MWWFLTVLWRFLATLGRFFRFSPLFSQTFGNLSFLFWFVDQQRTVRNFKPDIFSSFFGLHP